MNKALVHRLPVLAALAAAAAFPPAHADKVASPEEIRALRDKLAKSPPKPADYWAQPYPGATFDAECSARGAAPLLPDFALYCFYTRDPADKVRAFLAGEGKPRNAGVRVRVEERAKVVVDGYVRISDVTMIAYSMKPSSVAYFEGFPTSPPPAAELIAPLPADARYNRDCSANETIAARNNPQRWRAAWCFDVPAPIETVAKSFSSDLRFTRKHGVQVDLKPVAGATPATQVQYWLTTAPPEVPLVAAPPQPAPATAQPAAAPQATATAPQPAATTPQPGTAATAPQAATGATSPAAATPPQAAGTPPQQTTAAAPANPKPPAQGASAPANRPPPPAQDAAARAVETVNKLRGLFGK